jgi:hypothetical protein
MKSLLDHALAYAELGWYVFPCHHPLKKAGWSCSCELWKREKVNAEFECNRPGKHPRTENGLDDATTDADQIRSWWRKWPTANIGINCGKSGLLVIDLDTYKDTYRGDDLELNEDTVTALSGGGGAHLFYGMADGDTFGNSNKNLPAGVDPKAWGGYVIVSPSAHKSGNTYQWENDYSPWDKPLAPIPPKLRALLEENRKHDRPEVQFDTAKKYENGQGTIYGIAAINNQCKTISTAANGTRNNTLNSAAYALGRLVAGGELEYNYAYDNLYSAALQIDLSEAEAKQTIDSGIVAGMQKPYSTVLLEDDSDGFGECPDPATLFGSATPLVDDDIVRPVHIDEVQDAIDAMFKAGQPLEMIRDKYWQCIGNLKMSDRRLLATFLFNIGLFHNVKKAGEFADECARHLDSIPLIDRITTAIKALGHTFRLNLLEDTIEVDGRRVDDVFMSRLRLIIEGQKYKRQHVEDAVAVIAKENEFHPVRDYLLTLEWDGVRRLPTLLIYFHGDGVIATYPDGTEVPLHGLLIKRWLLGCVARALDGGKAEAFKHQTPMLVIIGRQGLGKSSFVRWLVSGVGYEFHQEGPVDPHKEEDWRSMVTKWIWEVAELGASLKKTDRDSLKGIITKEWHTYRKPYGRYNITKPTLCNFVGTINPETGFLDDPTGHRRFLPIQLTEIERGYADAIDINQLWAEIVALYLGGESPELSDIERDALAGVYEEHEVENPIQTYIAMYFHISPGSGKMRCSTADIINRLRQFGIALHSDVRIASRLINDTLTPLGLERDRWKENGVLIRGWRGIEPNNKTPFSNGF